MTRKLLILLAILAVTALGWFFIGRASGPEIYRFEGLEGPAEASVVAEATPPRVEDYEKGGPNRVAVLVTDPASEWLGLVRGFKAHGIPFTLTRNPDRALRHQVILAYPSISGRNLPAPALRGLAEHVRSGGTLLTFDLAGGGLEPVFGIGGQVPSRARTSIAWTGGGGSEADKITRFSQPGREAELGSYGIQTTTAETLAKYDDGAAAAACRSAGGRACLLGIDLGALAQRAMNGRGEPIARQYVNGYEPSLDTLFRWVRDLYVEGEDTPFLIGTAPQGREGSLILTHDVDYTRSVANAVAYADAARRRGVGATFFIQTKYVRDYNDEIFFNDANLPVLKKVAEGMEIGSHSVSHSSIYNRFPFGSGDESYPDYQPFVQTKEEARGGTVLGELRVPKFLIEKLVGAQVKSFRPGELSYPESLPQALAATGYSYSSSITANSTLTHLPFQLAHGRSGAGLVKAWEFPVTIEDEEAPRLGERLDAANRVVEAIARGGGVAVILIHPDITGHKLQFEERLIDAWEGRLWIGALGTFGDWWRARDESEIDFENGALDISAPQRLDGVTILFPKGSRKSIELHAVEGRRRITV